MIGDKIKQLRKENDITQEELAKNIGVSTSMVGMYETNSRKPSYEVLIKISKYFNVSTDFLLGENKYEPYMEKNEGKVEESSATYNSKDWGNSFDKIKSQEEKIKYLESIVDFADPKDAVQFLLKQPAIMGFGGFDINKMSDGEILEFANELLNQLKLLSYKYKK